MSTREALHASLDGSDEEIVARFALEAEAEPLSSTDTLVEIVTPRAELRVLTRLAAQALAFRDAPRARLNGIYLDEEGDLTAKFTVANEAIARRLGAHVFTTLVIAPPPFAREASNDDTPGRGVATRKDEA
jgi:hypothetical protein